MGADLYGTCPGCLAHWHLPAAPSAGRAAWSDGFQQTSAPPTLVACAACGALAWTQDTLSPTPPAAPPWWARWRPSATAKATVTPGIPGESVLLEALAGGFARSLAEERQLRMLAWWQHNHPQRTPLTTALEATAAAAAEEVEAVAWQANLRSLLPLLDAQQTGDALLRAEVLRHLGDFSAAQAALEPVVAEGAQWVVQALRARCVAHDPHVLELRR